MADDDEDPTTSNGMHIPDSFPSHPPAWTAKRHIMRYVRLDTVGETVVAYHE
jgi:hypothetical protein